MKRGFMLTLLALVMFIMLVHAAVQIRTERLKSSGWAQSMMADRKLLYATDDVAEDVRFAYGVKVVRSGNTLIFYDTLPANYSVDRSLRGYNDFVQDVYGTSDLEFQFYDDAGNPISLDQMPFELVVYPYNLTYHYQDFGKRVLEIYCAPDGPCDGDDVEFVGFEYEFHNANFTWLPFPGNESYYNWAPNFLGDCEGDPNCMNFTIKITDSRGYEFACPSEMCNYSQFISDSKSTLDIHMTPCWFEIRLGEDNIAMLRLHEPNNPNVLCSAVVDATTSINFSSSEYYLNLPGFVRASEVNYNFSRVLPLPGENLSGREIIGELPPSNETEASCFSYDAGGVYSGGAANKYVYGLKIGNSCPARNIVIDKMVISWVPDQNEKLEVVNINGTLVWLYNGQGSPDGWQPSGVTLDIVDFTLPESTTVDVNYLRFQQSMSGKSISIRFIFTDGSHVTVPANT